MKKWKLLQKEEQPDRNRTAFRGGTYALSITAVVLAILVVLNVLVSALPVSYTHLAHRALILTHSASKP